MFFQLSSMAKEELCVSSLYVCMYGHACLHTHIRIHASMYTSMYELYIYTQMHVFFIIAEKKHYASVHYIGMYRHIYSHTYIHTYTHQAGASYILTYTHTHT